MTNNANSRVPSIRDVIITRRRVRIQIQPVAKFHNCVTPGAGVISLIEYSWFHMFGDLKAEDFHQFVLLIIQKVKSYRNLLWNPRVKAWPQDSDRPISRSLPTDPILVTNANQGDWRNILAERVIILRICVAEEQLCRLRVIWQNLSSIGQICAVGKFEQYSISYEVWV